MDATRLLDSLGHWNAWGDRPLRTGVPRSLGPTLAPWLDRFETLAVCGLRRAGKTTLLRQLAASLLAAGLPARETLFVSFEEPVFLETTLTARTLDEVVDTYREHLRPQGVPTFFLDEIQNVAGWASWVRSWTENRRAHVVVSGSSSRLLEPELSTLLTGRNRTATLWPLSFAEFLRFRDRPLPAGPLDLHAGTLRPLLLEFLRYGGLPEVVLADEGLRDTMLKQVFRDILYRDVVSRHAVRDVRALEQVAHHLLVHTGALVTYNRMKNLYGLAMDQVRSYTKYLDESYLVREVPRFSYKVSEQARAPRKVYAVDLGLRNAVSFRFSEDLGRLAETAVFLHLVRDEDVRLFYHQGRGECDFVVWRADRALAAVQVCYEQGPLPAREVAGLVEACKALGLAEGTVITDREEATETVEGVTVRVVPLWKWLLGEAYRRS